MEGSKTFAFFLAFAAALSASRGQVLNCNFERDFCQWRQVTGTDNLDWQRHSGSTPSPNTGPSFDHTTGRNGSYIYFDSSHGTEGAKAQLYSPLLTVGRNNYTCLTFWYHMYGEHVSTLTLYHNKTRLWTRSGDQGNVWLQARITITAILHEEIIIEAVKGRGVKGDIAVDDISYRSGSCPSLAPVTHSPDTWKYQCEINENVTDILWILQSTNETETLSRCSVEFESCDQRLEDLARATINSTSSFLYISDSFVGQKDGRVGYAEIINGLRGEIRFDAKTNPMNRANGPSTETTEQTDASTDSPAGTDSLAAWQYQCQIRENVTDVLWILQVGNETETLSRCYIGSESCDQRLDDCAMATINRTSSLFNISANLEKVKSGRVGYAEMINGLNGEIRFDAKRNPIKWPCGPLTVTTGMLPSTKQTSDSTDYSRGRTSP